MENQTDSDWNNVQLSLVSGRPISFIQNLYSPLYVPRPTVQPELYASLTPQTYDEGLSGRLPEAEFEKATNFDLRASRGGKRVGRRAAAAGSAGRAWYQRRRRC